MSLMEAVNVSPRRPLAPTNEILMAFYLDVCACVYLGSKPASWLFIWRVYINFSLCCFLVLCTHTHTHSCTSNSIVHHAAGSSLPDHTHHHHHTLYKTASNRFCYSSLILHRSKHIKEIISNLTCFSLIFFNPQSEIYALCVCVASTIRLD